MNKLSVVIAVKNEEKNLAQCLESVKWANEIIIVDDYSIDATVEIAKRYTNKIYYNDSKGSFHDNKNLGLEKATGDWILSLDADEIIPAELAEEISQAIKLSQYSGYYLNRKNYFLGKWIRGCDWYPDYIIRLFKRAATQWPTDIHKAPKIKGGKVGKLQTPFIHYSYYSLNQYFEKFNQYTSRVATEEYSRGYIISWKNLILCFLLKPLYFFIIKYFLKLGIRDGFRGFFISISSALTVFVTYAKLWEMQNQNSKKSNFINRKSKN
jgi:glycosyltransferase involved in cell wall biosynthesis